MKVEELSSSLTPSTRNSVLLKFQTGKVDGIVCSDALARGIDIPSVDVVLSYDVPRHVKTYIHRIGRTARAGKLGTAITLLSANELNVFQVRYFHANDILTFNFKFNVGFWAHFCCCCSQSSKKVESKMLKRLKLRIMPKNPRRKIMPQHCNECKML